MKKKFLSLFLVLALVFTGNQQVYAAEELNLVSAYVLEEKLYMFSEMELSSKVSVIASLKINGEKEYSKVKRIEPQQFRGRVRYLFLIDTSGTMSGRKKEAEIIVSEILAKTENEVVVTVAAFGDDFHEPIVKDATDTDVVLQAIQNLSYRDDYTRMYQSVFKAYQYLENQGKETGEVTNIVLITDGKPTGETGDSNKETVSQYIAGTSFVILHTVGLAAWDSRAWDTLSKGTGVDVNRKEMGAKACGQEIAEYVNRLVAMEYNLKQIEDLETLDVELSISSEDKVICENVDILDLVVSNQGGNSGPVIIPPDGSEDEPDNSGNSETESNTPDNSEEEPDTSGSSETESDNSEDSDNSNAGDSDSDNTESTQSTEDDKITNDKEDDSTMWYLLGGGGIVLLLIVIMLLVLMKKRNMGTGTSRKAVSSQDAVRMKLVMLSGTCQSKNEIFYLQNELWIGSKRGCDILLSDDSINAKHARIFLQDGVVYIEDTDSASGTCIDGMRIHRVNRLRSGDVITIGNSNFRLMF